MNTEDLLYEMKQKCPLPLLLQRIGLERFVTTSGPSPLQVKESSQWSVYQCAGRWCYFDVNSNELGDEVGLLARLLRLDADQDLTSIALYYREIVKKGKRCAIKALPLNGNQHVLPHPLATTAAMSVIKATPTI